MKLYAIILTLLLLVSEPCLYLKWGGEHLSDNPELGEKKNVK
jgi:hypothetical protein